MKSSMIFADFSASCAASACPPSLSRSSSALAHHSSHLEHVNLGDRQDGLQLVIGLNEAAVVQLLGLDVDPEFLNRLRTSHLLPAADRRKACTQVHRSEETNALLLRSGGGLLGARLPVLPGLHALDLQRALRRRPLRLRGLRNRGLLRRCLGRHCDRLVTQAWSLEP